MNKGGAKKGTAVEERGSTKKREVGEKGRELGGNN